jgi:hypothetical protein
LAGGFNSFLISGKYLLALLKGTASMKTRTFFPFAAGLALGVVLTAALVYGPSRVKAAPAHTAAHYMDVSGSGPAVASINRLYAEGILVASSDKKFHGDQPVTRYEMAVLLDRFVHYVEQGRKPLHNLSASVTDSQVSAPVGHWAHASQMALLRGKFLPVNSPLVQPPGGEVVTAAQFSDAMATTVNRVSDRALPQTPDVDQID